MGIVREMKKALIVIDVQKFFLSGKTQGIVTKIREYLQNHAREYDLVYFTVFKNDSASPLWRISQWKGCVGSPDTDLCDELKPFANKYDLFYKNILSAAKVPAIKKGLQKSGIGEVDLCGFDTDCCVLATAYDVFDQGIKPVVLENLTWSTSEEELHVPALQMISRNIGFVTKV